ncbi:hypothetical protein NHJ13051_000732 [Beauveria bassiana]
MSLVLRFPAKLLQAGLEQPMRAEHLAIRPPSVPRDHKHGPSSGPAETARERAGSELVQRCKRCPPIIGAAEAGAANTFG